MLLAEGTDLIPEIFNTFREHIREVGVRENGFNPMTKILCGIVIIFAALIVLLSILPLGIPFHRHSIRWPDVVLPSLMFGSALCALLLMPRTNGVGRLFSALYACHMVYIGTSLLSMAFLMHNSDAQLNTTKATLRYLKIPIQSFKVDNDERLPQSLNELTPYLSTKNVPKDAFGQDFIYLPDFEHGTYKLLSVGKDGLQGTRDDIAN